MSGEMTFSREARQVYEEASDIAAGARMPLDSGHLVLAAFVVPCEAQSILIEKRVDLDRLTDAVRAMPPDNPETTGMIYSQAADIAVNVGSRQVTSVHLLMAVTRIPQSRAARALDRIGLPMNALRTHAMAHLTDPRLRRAATERLVGMGCIAQVLASQPPSSAVAHVAPSPPERGPARDDLTPLTFDGPPVHYDSVHGMDARDEGTPQGQLPRPVGTGRQTGRFALDPERFPTLNALGRNLTLEAEQGILDPLIGRRDELEKVVDILCKRRANNPLLLGDPGVGKSALVEGLASLMAGSGDRLPGLGDRVIVAISVADLLAGTSMRGSFAERLRDLKDEVLAADRRVILFIDEIHTIVGAGTGDGGLDASNDLKGALARGEFPCIGATTFGEYQKHILPDPALSRRFEAVFVREPTIEEADRILDGVAPVYASFHQVTIADGARKAAVRLTDRIIPDRSLPAKAIDVLDRAAARVRREGRQEVTRQDVIGVLAGLVGLPAEHLALSPIERLRGMKKFMTARVIGHDVALDAVVKVLSQNWARSGCRKPLGAFLLVGRPGVGKRTMALSMAEFLFSSAQALLEVNLADFAEQHSLSQLIGSPPGYVGHEEGGLLGDTLIRRPLLVILWHNVEMAHPSVQSLITQVLADGVTMDRRGRRLDFKNTVHCLTMSPIDDGTGGQGRPIGFGAAAGARPADRTQAILTKCRRALPLDLVATLDQCLLMDPPGSDAVSGIVTRVLASAAERLSSEFGATLDVDVAVAEELARRSGCGAGVGIVIESLVAEAILTPATEALLGRDSLDGARIRVLMARGRISIEVA